MTGTHAKRIATAIVLTSVVGAAVFLGGPFIFAAVVTFSVLGIWEFYSLFWTSGRYAFFRILGVSLCTALLAASYGGQSQAVVALVMGAFWLTAIGYTVAFGNVPDSRSGSGSFAVAMVTVMGLLYIPGMLQFFFGFSSAETALVLLATFASDTGAYYTGKKVGGRKLWPSVSPKKTWAGSFGGAGASIGVCLLVGLGWGVGSWWAWPLLGLVLSLAGQVGDLVESALKRSLDIKDSGSLLPGHGGILDRIDGLLLAAPVYALARSVYAFF